MGKKGKSVQETTGSVLLPLQAKVLSAERETEETVELTILIIPLILFLVVVSSVRARSMFFDFRVLHDPDLDLKMGMRRGRMVVRSVSSLE